MRTHHLPFVSLLLLTTAACGDGKSNDDGSMEPRTCFFGDVEYEDGEQFDSPEGCVTYECVDGGLSIADDRRATAPGDLELRTQAEVDAQLCLGQVEGTLRITEAATDLSPLGRLFRVGQGLEIVTGELQTTAGLEALTEVGGSVVIQDNEQLNQLSFNYAMSVFGDVTIQNNDALTSLGGAQFIGACGACSGIDGTPRSLAGEREPFPGGAGTSGAEGGAEPAGDEGGFDQPGGGTFYGNILIADNDVLADISAMSNLWYAWADVRFRNNAVLDSLNALSLNEVRGTLEITDHPMLPTINAQSFIDGVLVQGEVILCGNLDGDPCP